MIQNTDNREEQILDLLEEKPLRIEDVAAEVDADYSDVKETILDLHRRSLVVSGPSFTFETDRSKPTEYE